MIRLNLDEGSNMKQLAVIVSSFGLTLALLGCAGGESTEPAQPVAEPSGQADSAAPTEAVARIEPTSGNQLSGTATFRSTDRGVSLTLAVENAPPGEHAFHLHEVGDCSAPDGTSAGGHWNPTGRDHGAWGAEPFHLGDVGNLIVGDDGRGSIELTTDLWSIGGGAPDDVVGRAVIVHAGVDDFTTQPTGAAGGRIGCGVIQ